MYTFEDGFYARLSTQKFDYCGSLEVIEYHESQRKDSEVTLFKRNISKSNAQSVFCKKCGDGGESGEKKYFIAFLFIATKIHREIHRISFPNFTESGLKSQEKAKL